MTNRDLVSPLTSARQTEEMVGQAAAMEKLKQAILADDRSFKVVFVRAEGGMGKTRLLEETLRHLGHPTWLRNGETPRWTHSNDLLVSDLIDVINIRLHGRYRFLTELRSSLQTWSTSIDFRDYDRAVDEMRLLQASGAQLNRIRTAEQKASDAFLDDLRRISQQQRVVWIIDTVEQLGYVTSQWPLKRKRLTADDLRSRTHQWIQDFVANADLQNVTLVLAGRGREGKSFFKDVKRAFGRVGQAGGKRELVEIELQPLNDEETRAYFAQLADDWVNRADMSPDSRQFDAVARQFAAVANEKQDQSKVVWLYTGGIPVRLALYAHLIAEGRTIPRLLRLPFEEAVSLAGTDTPERPTNDLRYVQWQVEDEFINLLFRRPTDLQARVLQALVRAPRGLTAEQLHYALDSAADQGPEDWNPNPPRLRELHQVLREIETYYLGKRRASWIDFEALLPRHEVEAHTYRLGLQDEIYRIYTEHMAPHIEPISAETRRILPRFSAEELEQYQEKYEDEKAGRDWFYFKLRQWADYQHAAYRRMKQDDLEQDERLLEMRLILDDPRTFRFPELSDPEVERRLAVVNAMNIFEIERMVYDLLRDPDHNLNTSYAEEDVNRQTAGLQELDFWAQTEMWRVLHDDWAMKFIAIHTRKATEERRETVIQVLRRFAQQEDVTRWIKRFVFRGEYERAIRFAAEVEADIGNLPKGEAGSSQWHEWHSWNHRLAWGERQLWALYGLILHTKDVEAAVESVEKIVPELERLFDFSANQVATTWPDGYEEPGFAPDVKNGLPAHPAWPRVRRLLSYAYNIQGYGQIMLGQVQNAVASYGRALDYIRDDKDLMKPHRAVVLNNLSRALSELGWQSTAVCLDGLQYRRELAEEVPLAASYNTLALIYDDMGRYEDAPILSAKAIAYSRRASNQRQLALSLRQMGESLRHLAVRVQTGQRATATAESLYTAADTLLREARLVFQELKEYAREVQVSIELGSLYRDRLRPDAKGVRPRSWQSYYREALSHLVGADERARELNLPHYVMDARINIARVYLYAGEREEASKVLTAIEKAAPYEFKIVSKQDIPDSDSEKLRDRAWIFRQLSNVWLYQGVLAMSHFRDRVAYYKNLYRDKREKRIEATIGDKEALNALSDAAKAYALGIGYAELFSPRSRAIGQVLDDLYEQLKGSNRNELQAFHERLLELHEDFPKLASIDLLDNFLHQFFGMPFQEGTHHG